MKLFRARNPIAIDYLKENIKPDEGFDREEFCDTLKRALVDIPESCFITIGFEGDEVRGFVVSTAVPNQTYVFLHQVWTLDEGEDSLRDRLVVRLCLWANSLGRSEIRSDDQRLAKRFLDVWKFRPISRVMSLEVPEDLELELIKDRTLDEGKKKEIKKKDNSLAELSSKKPEVKKDGIRTSLDPKPASKKIK